MCEYGGNPIFKNVCKTSPLAPEYCASGDTLVDVEGSSIKEINIYPQWLYDDVYKETRHAVWFESLRSEKHLLKRTIFINYENAIFFYQKMIYHLLYEM